MFAKDNIWANHVELCMPSLLRVMDLVRVSIRIERSFLFKIMAVFVLP